MIALVSVDEQKKCPRAVMRMRKGKATLEEDFAIRKHCRIVLETELTCLFNAAYLKMPVFADFIVFSCLRLINNFVVNVV